jgi:hypothetical protein
MDMNYEVKTMARAIPLNPTERRRKIKEGRMIFSVCASRLKKLYVQIVGNARIY